VVLGGGGGSTGLWSCQVSWSGFIKQLISDPPELMGREGGGGGSDMHGGEWVGNLG
jgi:hypothetical protein